MPELTFLIFFQNNSTFHLGTVQCTYMIHKTLCFNRTKSNGTNKLLFKLYRLNVIIQNEGD